MTIGLSVTDVALSYVKKKEKKSDTQEATRAILVLSGRLVNHSIPELSCGRWVAGRVGIGDGELLI